MAHIGRAGLWGVWAVQPHRAPWQQGCHGASVAGPRGGTACSYPYHCSMTVLPPLIPAASAHTGRGEQWGSEENYSIKYSEMGVATEGCRHWGHCTALRPKASPAYRKMIRYWLIFQDSAILGLYLIHLVPVQQNYRNICNKIDAGSLF